MLKRLLLTALVSAAACGAEPAKGKTEWTQRFKGCRVTLRTNCPDARAEVGDTVKIALEPWEKREAEFGSWNRSEFDEEALLLAEPLFGTLKNQE